MSGESDSRERATVVPPEDTVPGGLERPSEPPEDIPSGPPWARELLKLAREEKTDRRRMMADLRMLRKQFVSFREEARMRFRSLEEQVRDLEERTENGEFNQEQFSDILADLRKEFEQLKRRVDPYLDDGR